MECKVSKLNCQTKKRRNWKGKALIKAWNIKKIQVIRK